MDRSRARELAAAAVAPLVVADDGLEREWGFIFYPMSPGGGSDLERTPLGAGPVFVHREDGAIHRWGSRMPLEGWIRLHERELAGGGLRGWWRTSVLPWLRGRPRGSDAPRMPASQDEADRIHRCWDRLNGRYFFVAEVELDDGRVLPSVTFDSDTNIAVEVGDVAVGLRFDLVGRPIARLARL